MASFPFVMSERWAVSTLFLVNGFAIGSWAVHIPEFVERLAISEGTLGLLIAVFGLGSLIAMPLAGATIAKIGDAPVTKVLSLIATTSLLLVGLAPNIWLSGAALFLFGALIASMDVAMNATAVEVEKSIRKPIMSSCHGFWSLGGLLSAFLGGFVIQAAGGWVQILVVTGLAIVLVVISVPNIAGHAVRRHEKGQPLRFPRSLLAYVFGIIALCSAMPEGAVIDWSTLYMRTELLADPITASTAFALFSGAMAIVRFAGDPIRMKWGAVRTARVCAVTGAIGFLLAGFASDPWVAIVGFAVTGFGLANLVPIAFSAAGNQPDMPPGIGISITTTIGYSGLLVFPALLGYLAEFIGFSLLFILLAIPMVAVFLMAGKTAYADMN